MANKKIQLKDKDGNNLYPALVKQCILDIVYPVGSIYLSVNNTNPSTLFGGTWEQIAKGRTLVGVDTNDSDFNTVKKTGGAKTHYHTVNSHSHGSGTLAACYDPKNSYNNACYKKRNVEGGYTLDGYMSETRGWNSEGGSSGVGTAVYGYTDVNSPDTNSKSNLQPYYTCYIWCRTN